MNRKVFSFFLALLMLVSANTAAFAEALPKEISEPYGRPWVTTYDAGNLPAERTRPADDLNIYANFDLFDANRDTNPTIQSALETMREVREKLTKLITEENYTTPELDQLRIFFDQAGDIETIDALGIEPVRPYLDRIDAARSIEDLNAILTSEDFPFTPFVSCYLSCNDMRDVTSYALFPNFLTADNFDGAGGMQDDGGSILAIAAGMGDTMIVNAALQQIFGDGVDIDLISGNIVSFEKAYGKYAMYNERIQLADYGDMQSFYSYMTLDELSAHLPNWPVAAMLIKEGCAPDLTYKIPCIAWMEKLNELWTEENLETIRYSMEVSIIKECANYLTTDISRGPEIIQKLFEGLAADSSPEELDDVIASIGRDPLKRGYDACASVNTFSMLLGKLYVEHILDPQIKPELEALTDGLIDKYEELFNRTDWMSDTARDKAIEKLRNIRSCILVPDGGFYSFEGLELVPTSEGGTLFDNYLRIKAFVRDYRNSIAGTPARALFAWDALGPVAVNCFYDPEVNSICVFPGFITSGIYEKFDTREGLFAAIGVTIGHELSHGFDFMGSQADAYGVMEPLFTDADRESYLERVDRLVKYYDGIEIEPGCNVDGNHVKVEAAADLCGMQVCLEYAKDFEDFDYARFFETFAALYADITPAGTAALMSSFDMHPLAYLRINVNAQMQDAFYETYDVREGDGMYLAPENRIRIFG